MKQALNYIDLEELLERKEAEKFLTVWEGTYVQDLPPHVLEHFRFLRERNLVRESYESWFGFLWNRAKVIRP